jgi:hypothetical protein
MFSPSGTPDGLNLVLWANLPTYDPETSIGVGSTSYIRMKQWVIQGKRKIG